MASKQIQGPGHAQALETIDGLIQEIDSNIPRLQTPQGPEVTDQQTARILRVLRIMRNEIASLIPQDDDDAFVYDHGDPTEQS